MRGKKKNAKEKNEWHNIVTCPLLYDIVFLCFIHYYTSRRISIVTVIIKFYNCIGLNVLLFFSFRNWTSKWTRVLFFFFLFCVLMTMFLTFVLCLVILYRFKCFCTFYLIPYVLCVVKTNEVKGSKVI